MPSAMEQPSTRLHIDELIMDYLLWYCTSSLLTERRLRVEESNKREYAEASRNSDMGMKLVNSFYQTFQRLHPQSPFPEPITLRLRICRFAAVLLRRIDVTAHDFAPSTEACRRRTQGWLRRKGVTSVLSDHANLFTQPFSASLQQRNTEALLVNLGHTPDSIFGSATLRDALWEFLLMTTHLSARHSEVNEMWMVTTVDFMTQAVLEAYRCHGCTGVDAVNESFSVGLTEMGDLDQSIEEIVVSEMFAGDDGKVGEEFESLRIPALLEILPPPGTTLEMHYENLAKENPWIDFEDRITKYLMTSTKSLARPVLAQLEQGRLEGFDTREIQAVLASAGISEEVWR